MRSLPALSVLVMLGFLAAPAQAASAIPDDFIPTHACGTLGTTHMAYDNSSLVICALDTGVASESVTCETGGGCTWKAMSGGIPIGTIVMWSGAIGSIPTGWHLCDGLDGTPDLRGSFVYGAPAGNNPGGPHYMAVSGSDWGPITTPGGCGIYCGGWSVSPNRYYYVAFIIKQ